VKQTQRNWRAIGFTCLILLTPSLPTQAEVVLQFFNNTWNEIAEKIPELAEVGYDALWLPPPQKASGALSVGYDLWDPFDLGGKDQRGTVKTRYGTEEELLRLIETAHRFGMRVYFDNIMNHRAFDIPGYNENTPVDIYPGMLPEDFHLRVTEDGFYRKWDNTQNWGNTWEVQMRNLSDLIDIAHETPNGNFGAGEGYTHAKISFVRHPNNPEYYDYHPTLGHVGFGSTNITASLLASNPAGFFNEDVGGYLCRSVRWLIDQTKVDGLRLDAVKHVPAYFFGKQDGADKDGSSDGYCGQAQWQFNMTRGFSDWDNHRDTVFDTEKSYGRNDLMMFGEHMGEPPPYSDYWAAGMRLLDARTHSTLNDKLGNPSADLNGLQNSYYVEGFQMGENLGVYYAKSHDDNVAYREELHYALNLTRAGLPDIYTDGNRQAETLGQSGGAFPRHANTKYLGQWGDNRIPNLVYVHNQFARSWQYGRWADNDVVAYDRIDKRENTGMSDADGCVLSFMINDNYSGGSYREIPTAFPEGSLLWQYSTGGGNFYTQVSGGKIKVIIPPGGYFAFSWRNPEESDLWKNAGGKPVMLYENGRECGWVSYVRRDGPDGDPGFNPYGTYDPINNDYSYTWYVPRVTSPTNLRLVARVDGSANNVLFKLDGGIHLNNQTHSSGDLRDHPPGNEGSTDVYLGYEQAEFLQRMKPEKFAAKDTLHNRIGSPGAETYVATIGSSGFTINTGDASNDYLRTLTPSWVFHDPEATITASNQSAQTHFTPAPQSAADQPVAVWVKLGYGCDASRVYLYYTTDGASWPEGAGGYGVGQTRVVELSWVTADQADGSIDWWRGTLPAMSAGTVLRYKIGAYKQEGYGCVTDDWYVPFPNSWTDIGNKMKMMGAWQVTNLNARTVTYYPHNDFGQVSTGLVDGFHVVSARAFLQRDSRAAIYNTFVQPFYLDLETPKGEVKYPGENDELWQNEYGVVVRTDPTVQQAWFNITDGNPANDDANTGVANGNGTNAAGQIAWVQAYSVTPSLSIASSYPNEWRFSYRNIPTNGSGNATIAVKLTELSSSTNLNLSDVDGHFTTLTRHVWPHGPDTTFQFGWPTVEGTHVETGWEIWVKFSKSLVDPFNDTDMRDRFLIKINDVSQGKDAYVIEREYESGFGRIKYALPALYNGDTNFPHHIAVTFLTQGSVTLQANQYVKAKPTAAGPAIQIVDPPEYDSDGQPYEIVLPDVASPSSTQRQYRIRVETDQQARNVWISFTNSFGHVARIPTTTNLLTGTVSVVQGTNLVTGAGTLFDSQLGPGNQIKISTNLVTVLQIVSSNSLLLSGTYPGPTASGVTALRIDSNPSLSGNKQYWEYLWTNITQGSFRFHALVNTNDNSENFIHAYAVRNTRVIFRQIVTSNTNKLDDDDDGLEDLWETTQTNLPSTNPETWTNGVVHKWYTWGKTDPLRPDTDGDGLPDGLELGYRVPATDTSTNADTNGDGQPNFQPDYDPPIYNTVPDNNSLIAYNFNDSRTKQIYGTTTDPNNSDSDYDGLSDGVEDRDHNGWVNGDGEGMPPSWNPWRDRLWPNGVMDVGETWTETSPGLSDSDRDGLSDGYGEDKNFNGAIDGDTNSNRIWNAGELWTETNPLNPDTDGDGLPDGWEVQYGLNPWDCGIVGRTNLQTGAIIANAENGASGNPDNDKIAFGGVTNDYSNIMEYQNGTNPRYPDSGEAPPEGQITVGPGPVIGVLNGVTNYQEFMDWSWDDMVVLDEYEGDGPNNQQGDLFLRWDGYDTSRDIVAFYAKDGGDNGSGGDGRFYFRADFHDLQAHAEEGYLDIYVVIDTGNPAQGEAGLPDEVDAMTSNRWEAIVAVYQGNSGRVYIDTDRNHNSTTIADSYNLASFGVVARDQSAAEGFKGAYYSAPLDSVEFAISRQALIDAGWNGLDPDDLNFQVFITKDGTCNSCGEEGKPGPGDIGGRNDFCDTIYDDDVCEDYWEAQQGIKNVLSHWFNAGQHAGRAKAAFMTHGNQAIQPGNVMQNLINNGSGAGYYRPLDSHEMYRQPINLHITPTLASAIQWAQVDPAAGTPWRDGPALNRRIASLAATGIVELAASTFSDHILPYFTPAFNRDNVALANEYLHDLYGVTLSTNSVFWTPERVLDADSFSKILNAGYQYTILDQDTHLWNWFSRTDALGENGYSINRMHGVKCFVINNLPTTYRFSNNDSGLSMSMRRLFSKRARGAQDRVTTIFSNWEDFGANASADAYDVNLRWLANHPWVQVVSFKQIADGQIDSNSDGYGDQWWYLDRGNFLITNKQGHAWINHATQGDYDHWYLGSSTEEGLLGKIFDIRSGVPIPKAYGMMYTAGILTDTWDEVNSIADTNLARLARATLHASVFQTAFHEEDNNDLSRWSTGEFMYPDTSSNALSGFAKQAQAQSRMAAIYAHVDTWAGQANAGWYANSVGAANTDVDLDGETEYLIYNDRLFAVFERIGGRMIGAWARDILNNRIYQAAGNLVGNAGSETEAEGAWNVETNGTVVAYRTSCFKDWWIEQGADKTRYVNNLYSATYWTNGWRFTSSDGDLKKTITLAPKSSDLVAQYQLTGALAGAPLYIRHGLNPNLEDLLRRGQTTLASVQNAGGVVTLSNTNYIDTVVNTIGYVGSGNNAGVNLTAVDDNPGNGVSFYTINMRNQAQTHQVETVGTNTFTFALGFRAYPSDWSGDGMPNEWVDQYGLSTNAQGGAQQDADGDNLKNVQEYIAGTDPNNPNDYLAFQQSVSSSTGITVRFPTKTQRQYTIDYINGSLVSPNWATATPTPINGTGGVYEWVDNGTQTTPAPQTATNRYYKVNVKLPE
jgi:hypothetical protein